MTTPTSISSLIGCTKIEHLGFAVSDLAKAEERYTLIFGCQPYKREEVKSQEVITSFFRLGESKIELLQATSRESTIAKFIEKQGEGFHHVAFAVEDIWKEIARLQKAGIRILFPEPFSGADKKLVTFLHPKDTQGVLVELCMDQPQ